MYILRESALHFARPAKGTVINIFRKGTGLVVRGGYEAIIDPRMESYRLHGSYIFLSCLVSKSRQVYNLPPHGYSSA